MSVALDQVPLERLKLVLDPCVRERTELGRAELEVLAHVHLNGGDHCGCCDCRTCGNCWACGDCPCAEPAIGWRPWCEPPEWHPRPEGLPDA